MARLELRLLGLETGPAFPAQAMLSDDFVAEIERIIAASGVLKWVDWDQAVWSG